MLPDLLYIEGQLSILLSELPEDLSAEATSSLLGALLRLRRVISRETTKTPPTDLLEPLEEALADIESYITPGPPDNGWADATHPPSYIVGLSDGYRSALRFVEAAYATISDTLQEGTTAHATR